MNNSSVKSASILGIAIIIGAVCWSYSFYQVRALDNTLSVTGSAKKTVQSDSVKWVGSITRNIYISDIKSGYTNIDKDLKIFRSFLKNKGIQDDEITISPVFMEYVYKGNDGGPQEYTLRQTITVNSKDVPRITDVSKNIGEIINQGVVFSTGSLEYYYSGLPELRVALLGDALRDAKARADQIAGATGKKVGNLRAASSGVVQVLAPNSIEVSDYGQYDTQSIEKEIMVTVRGSFTLK